uniref:EamA domain-containing protein n=1 Tax=Pseudictyota dubia TaxID=2749911 RepID=A0A7R9ZHZ7_9STRA|mmetsp:Transcript_6683/g.11841  ORF Transcript_6683/g.11841 Transcript_6683/m.11841 type:complete len:400 (+) Transcript_6683:234-1433(+)
MEVSTKEDFSMRSSSRPNQDGDGGSRLVDVQKDPFLVRTLSSVLSGSGPRHSLVGIVLIMLGSFSFSCEFLFVKLMEGKANSFTVTFYRALVEIPIALWLCERRSIDDYIGPPRARAWLLVRGGMGAPAVLCFFYAIQHLPLPDAVTLQFTTPPFAAAFAVMFAGERWKLLDMIGAVVCLFGVMLIAHPTWLFGSEAPTEEGGDHAGENSMAAIVIGLLGAAFAGLAYTSVRMIGHDTSANVMVLYYAVMSVPVTMFGSKVCIGSWNVWHGGGNLGAWDWCWMVLTGLTAYAGQYLTNLGLQYETAATGTLATCSQIVFTYIFELVFLHELINVWSILGSLLIIGFMAIVGILKMKDADETMHETVAGEPEELALLFSAEHHNRYDCRMIDGSEPGNIA